MAKKTPRTDHSVRKLQYRGPLLPSAERLSPNRFKLRDPDTGKADYPHWKDQEQEK